MTCLSVRPVLFFVASRLNHFQADAIPGFLREVARILRPGGLFLSAEWGAHPTLHPEHPWFPELEDYIPQTIMFYDFASCVFRLSLGGVSYSRRRLQDRRADTRAGYFPPHLPERRFREACVEATGHTHLRASCVRLVWTPLCQRGDGTRHARLRRRARSGALCATGCRG